MHIFKSLYTNCCVSDIVSRCFFKCGCFSDNLAEENCPDFCGLQTLHS